MKSLFAILCCSTMLLVSCSGNDVRLDETGNSTSKDCKAPDVYKIGNKTYKTLRTVDGFRERGIATVYPASKYGKATPICEELSAENFTGSHRTLPLPSYIKLTNLSNKKAVVIRINDRGPGNQNEIIQVTPAVANILGISGKAQVEIEALSDQNTRQSNSNPAKTKSKKQQAFTSTKTTNVKSGSDRYYIILGTYADQVKAFNKFVRISSIGLPKATIESRNKDGRMLHMVRLGPFYSQDELDHLRDRLQNDGLIDYKVVKN